ncbi:MAG: EAL domain-containing protein [Pseudomonadales bacterium]
MVLIFNKNDYALVQSINEIAHLMGKETIAEYAESEEIIHLLDEIGVDYIQGFAVSKPIPLDDIYKHIAITGALPEPQPVITSTEH